MFALVREVHAYCGLLLLLFVAMYAATGLPLTHRDWFDLEAEPVVTEVALEFTGDPDGSELPAYLAEEFGVSGRRTRQTFEDGTRSLMFARPGWTVRFEVAPDLRSARIFEREGTVVQKAVQLHRLKGFGGGWEFAVWGLLLDAVSLAMLVFVVTGTYLWYVRSKDRRLGWALLALSWGFTAALSAYLYFAP